MTIAQRVPEGLDWRMERRRVDFLEAPGLLWDLAPEQPGFLWSRGPEEMIVTSGVRGPLSRWSPAWSVALHLRLPVEGSLSSAEKAWASSGSREGSQAR